MKTSLFSTAVILFVVSAPAVAVSGGMLDTIPRGHYVCEMPGDAATTRGILMPDHDFEITNSSTYRTPKGGGTYLRTGDDVRITSGPKKGEHYEMKSDRYMRLLDAKGAETGMRCVKRGSGAF